METDTLPVFRSLSESPLLPLRILGLSGRLQRNDITALAEVEKDLPRLAGASESHRFALGLMGLQLANNPEAAHTVARIALSDPTLPGFESSLASNLGQMHSLEFLSYSMLLLDSSDPYSRAMAMMATCQILQHSQPALWNPAMQPHCPDHAPLNDPQREQAGIQFWKQWWAAQREPIAQVVTLPDPRPPARWSAPRPGTGNSWQPAPLEIRIESLLRLVADKPSHAHDAAGTIVAAPEYPTIADSLLQNPADREIFHEVAKAAAAKTEEFNTRVNTAMNAARLSGTMPRLEQMRKIESDRQSALKQTVEDLRSRLTPEGWKAIETFGQGGAVASSAAPQQ